MTPHLHIQNDKGDLSRLETIYLWAAAAVLLCTVVNEAPIMELKWEPFYIWKKNMRKLILEEGPYKHAAC